MALADLRGLPPLYLQVAEYDTVREGALRVAQSATRAGVRVLLESWPGVVHAWQGLADQGVPLVVTYHPAYLLRNLADKSRAWDDLCLAAQTVEAASAPRD